MSRKMRSEFEAWTNSIQLVASFDLNSDGSYVNMQVQYLWASWQAATALKDQTAAIPAALTKIGELLRTQDSDCTANPLFVVEKCSILTGIDTDYCDTDEDIVYVIEDEMIFKGHLEFDALEAHFKAHDEVPENYTRTGYSKSWEMVQPFFTREAAEAYINRHGHKHGGELRMSIESAYRNDEIQSVLNWLASLPETTVQPESKSLDGSEASP